MNAWKQFLIQHYFQMTSAMHPHIALKYKRRISACLTNQTEGIAAAPSWNAKWGVKEIRTSGDTIKTGKFLGATQQPFPSLFSILRTFHILCNGWEALFYYSFLPIAQPTQYFPSKAEQKSGFWAQKVRKIWSWGFCIAAVVCSPVLIRTDATFQKETMHQAGALIKA